MKTDKLTDRAYRVIRASLGDQAVRVGDSLPSERKLGAQIGVSRTVVRRAFERLERDHLIRQQLGQAPRVVSPKDQKNAQLTVTAVFPTLNGYSSLLFHGIDRALGEQSCSLNLILTYGDPQLEQRRLSPQQDRMDGLIVYSAFRAWDDLGRMYQSLVREKIPMVFIDHAIPNVACDAVMLDHYANMYQLTSNLLESGVDRLVYVGPKGPDFPQNLLPGVRTCLRDWSHTENPAPVLQEETFEPRGTIREEYDLEDIHRCLPLDDILKRILDAASETHKVGIVTSDGFIASALLDLIERWEILPKYWPRIVAGGKPPVSANAGALAGWMEVPKEDDWGVAGRMLLERINGYDGAPRRTSLSSTFRARRGRQEKRRKRNHE